MKIRFSHLAAVLVPVVGGTLALAQAGVVVAGGGASTALRPDSIQDGDMFGYYMNTDAQNRAGGSLLGRVVVAGSPLLWDPIPIHVICAGKVAFTSYASPKGGFVIQAVNANGALSMQGDAKRQMETHFDGCSVTAALSGYSSSSIVLTGRNFRDAPDIGTLSLKSTEQAKGTALSSTTQDIAPKAVKLFERARDEWEAHSLEHAKKLLEEAVAADPKFAEAWYQLGKLEQSASPDKAREDYAKAVAADPRFISPYQQLMLLDSEQGKWKDSLEDGSHALALDAHGTPQIWYVYAEGILKAYAAGALPPTKLKVAETSALNAMSLDPQHTIPAEQLVALILAEEKNYDGAINHLQNCLSYMPKGAGQDQVKQQIAQLEQLKTGAAK